VIGADVEFIAPDDDYFLLPKWQSSIGKLRETGMYSDCTLMVGLE
jgi:hypothetical protein